MVKSIIEHLAEKGIHAPQIAEIWSLDTFNSGQAALLNRELLGTAVSWLDQARDCQNFVEYYLPPRNGRPSAEHLLIRQERGLARRTHRIVGLGHSFSATGLMMLGSLGLDHFDGIFLIDPMGVPAVDYPHLPAPVDNPMARGAVARKEIFPSRSAAREYMAGRKYYAVWDPRVLQLHVQHGLYPLAGRDGAKEDGPVALCMSRWSEAVSGSTFYTGTAAVEQVHRSAFRGWAHLICMSETPSIYFGADGPETLQEAFCAEYSDRATCETLAGDHLAVQVQPDVLAGRLAEILSQHEAQGTNSKL